VEAAVNYVAATSPFAPLLARCEALLLVASCDDVQQPLVPQNHVSPLVDYQLPVSVQEFFLCFISDDHQFNTKVAPSHSIPFVPAQPHCVCSVSRCFGQPQYLQYAVAGRGLRSSRQALLQFRVEAKI
jgi:hypothetical protein